MDLPKLENLDCQGKKVIVRLDLDCEPDTSDLRISSCFETLDYLKEKNAQIIIISHRGRPTPSDKDKEEFSLKPFEEIFSKYQAAIQPNLRFDPGEEANSPEFVAKLASLGDAYVNEAFAASHREHASFVGLAKHFAQKSPNLVAVGFRFQKEINNLSRLISDGQRPFVFLLSGVKKDKLNYLDPLKKIADKILIGGKLPLFLGDEMLVSVRVRGEDEQVVVGNLIMDTRDITLNTAERFIKEIDNAKTIVVSGPLGEYEDEGHRQGTQKVFEAVSKAKAFKVAGGGDTEKAITLLGIFDSFDWISVGGGAMLEFLTKKTLPAIQALLH